MAFGGLGLAGMNHSMKKPTKKCERCGLRYAKEDSKCDHCGDLNEQQLRELMENIKKEQIANRTLGKRFFVIAFLLLLILTITYL